MKNNDIIKNDDMLADDQLKEIFSSLRSEYVCGDIVLDKIAKCKSKMPFILAGAVIASILSLSATIYFLINSKFGQIITVHFKTAKDYCDTQLHILIKPFYAEINPMFLYMLSAITIALVLELFLRRYLFNRYIKKYH